jgi:basic membrane lipoprotein Med (substrate-binding protein (PBP1-ABC) superfamily)
MKKIAIAACVVLGSGLLAAGCGSDDGGGGGGDSSLDITWLYFGPEDDGGYNVAMRASQDAAAEATGVESRALYQIPFTARATQAAEQAAAAGSNVIVDTIGLGELFSQDFCAQNEEVTCITTADPSKLPPNARNYWIQDWDFNYVAGVAAGLMTKSDTVGFIGAFEIPIIVQAANSYQMGCRSVNPDCETRVIISGEYFNPPKNNQAVDTLIDSGADVIRNWVDDPGFCQVAQRRGVYAVGEFYDFHEACPDSIITSTEWSFTEYFTEQYEAIEDGTFEPGGSDLVPVGFGDDVPHLATWGDFVPDDVRQQVEQVYQDIVDGKEVIVGPISDQDGKLRYKEGEVVPEDYIWTKWDWYVDGIISG